jgi:hypothetical protein
MKGEKDLSVCFVAQFQMNISDEVMTLEEYVYFLKVSIVALGNFKIFELICKFFKKIKACFSFDNNKAKFLKKAEFVTFLSIVDHFCLQRIMKQPVNPKQVQKSFLSSKS